MTIGSVWKGPTGEGERIENVEEHSNDRGPCLGRVIRENCLEKGYLDATGEELYE